MGVTPTIALTAAMIAAAVLPDRAQQLFHKSGYQSVTRLAVLFGGRGGGR